MSLCWLCCTALRDEIEAANKKFMACFKAQDANALSMLYTEDCKVMATGMDVQTGRQGTLNVCFNRIVQLNKVGIN